jgi:hypothetical protein
MAFIPESISHRFYRQLTLFQFEVYPKLLFSYFSFLLFVIRKRRQAFECQSEFPMLLHR